MKCCTSKVATGGQLKRKIIIQTATKVQDDFGEETETWANTATMWASIQPVSGSEGITGNQINPEVTHKIMMRYRAGVTPANRVLYGTRVFDINVVRNIFEENRWLELLCREDI